MSVDACQTLRLRDDYYQLKKRNMLQQYRNFLDGKISLSELEQQCGLRQKALTINETIDTGTIDGILAKINSKLSNRQVHGIIGGPPCQAYSTVEGSVMRLRRKLTSEFICIASIFSF